MSRRLLILTFISIIILGGLHQIGSLFYLYWDLVWFDTFMHFLGGFSIALLFIWFWYRTGNVTLRRKTVLYTLIFIAVVSLSWEVFEYAFDIANPTGGNYTVDTMHDLLADFLGAILAGYIGTRKVFHE